MPGSGGSTSYAPVIIVVVVVFLAIVIGVMVFTARREKERLAELQAFALRRDFSFTPQDNALRRHLTGSPFEAGSSRTCRNVIRGRSAGWPFAVFDYSYETTSTTTTSNPEGGTSTSTTSTTHRVQVLLFEVPPQWPQLEVTPRRFGSKIAVALGGQDVAVGHPGFERRFRVRSADPTAARKLLLPMTPQLLARANGPTEAGQPVRIGGGVLVTSRPGTLLAAELDSWIGTFTAALTAAAAVENGPAEQQLS